MPINEIALAKAQNELAEFLVNHPEHFQFQLSIDAALDDIGDNPKQRMIYLAKLMQHYVVDMAVEFHMLNKDMEEIKNKLK